MQPAEKINGNKTFLAEITDARFVISALILLCCFLFLNSSLKILSQKYCKYPVDIRLPLKSFDTSALTSFKSNWNVSILPVNPQEVGTTESFYSRFQQTFSQKQSAHLFITYYSDPKDKIPHTPDVCSRQGGDIIDKLTTIEFDVPQISDKPIKGRLMIHQDAKTRKATIYLFCVEGLFADSREMARLILKKPGNKFSYFSKIEAMSPFDFDQSPDRSIELCKQMLKEAIPVLINKHFPTKEQLSGKQ